MVDTEVIARRLRTCRADLVDLRANLAALFDSPGLSGAAGDRLRSEWAQFRPALEALDAALVAAREETEQPVR